MKAAEIYNQVKQHVSKATLDIISGLGWILALGILYQQLWKRIADPFCLL